jgi:DNA-binding transcriptional ArsR family regulator
MTGNSQSSVVSILRVAGDYTRLSILYALAEGERSVSELRATIAQSQTGISHHLALLRHRSLVGSHRKGKRYFYCLTEQGKHVAELARTLDRAEPSGGRLVMTPSLIDPKLLEDVGAFVDDPEGWFRKPNAAFEGRPPIELLGTQDEPRLRSRIAAAKLGMFS